MISLTRKSDYALVAVTGLAAEPRRRHSAREIAERLRLPLPMLRNILKDLAQHGLVCAEQGSQGGYRLALDPRNITVAAVVEAIEGAAKLTPCCHSVAPDDGAPACRLESSCLIKSSVRALHDRLNDVLYRTTIADLLDASSESASHDAHTPPAPSRVSGVSISTE